MPSLDYADIPSYATRLQSDTIGDDINPASKVTTSLPRPEHAPRSLSSPTSAQSMSPSKVAFASIPQLLLSSTLQLPANLPATPRSTDKGVPRLITTRDPLSIPITTVNFRRFVARCGPVFWLQDRIEEIVMWRKGWRYTAVWMAVYAFLCYFPRMVLLLPHVVVLSIMIVTHPSLHSDSADVPKPQSPTSPAQTSEGSVDWLANVQAIQNLMGTFSDFCDYVIPIVPHLTHSSPYTSVILTFTLASLLVMIPIVYILPLRTTFLVLGLFPLMCTHPFTRLTLFPALFVGARPLLSSLRVWLMRIVDNDRLQDKHWRAEMKEVELFENERWVASGGSSNNDDHGIPDVRWSKANLKVGERKPWTRGRDGWSGVTDDGSGDVSSNLTFALSSGWSFVETEDWRPDLEGAWIAPNGADDNGWIYTNDAWLDPHPVPLEEWKAIGMTRRRRWTRRVYYSSTSGR